MRRLAAPLAVVALLSLLMTGPLGCKVEPSVRSSVSTTVDGRTIKGSFDTPSSIKGGGGTAVLTFSGHTLTVERERLLLDGKEKVRIPATTASIEVEFKKGALVVRSDGTNVLSLKLAP